MCEDGGLLPVEGNARRSLWKFATWHCSNNVSLIKSSLLVSYPIQSANNLFRYPYFARYCVTSIRVVKLTFQSCLSLSLSTIVSFHTAQGMFVFKFSLWVRLPLALGPTAQHFINCRPISIFQQWLVKCQGAFCWHLLMTLIFYSLRWRHSM